jgi:hypothetical protein
MDFILTGIQLFALLGLIVGGAVYAYFKLKWAKEAAERRANSERLRASRLERELEETRAAMGASGLRLLDEIRTGVGPLDNPPSGIDPLLAFLQDNHPDDPYTIGLGWERVEGVPSVPAVSLHGDSPIRVNNIAVSGENDSGKGIFAFLLLSQLCTNLTPEQFRVVWIDPKRDGMLLKGMAHLWVTPCLEDQEIMDALHLMALERRRRNRFREQHQVLRWEELPIDVRPPMLWCYVGELDLIAQAIQRVLGLSWGQAEEWLDSWLTGEMVSARAEGIRYLVDVQDLANRRTRWRKQIACFAAGYTNTPDGIKPALNMGIEDIKKAGAIPPTQFRAPGYFTIRVKTDVATVRTPLITLDDRKRIIAALPRVSFTIPVTDRLRRLRQAMGEAVDGAAAHDHPPLAAAPAEEYTAPARSSPSPLPRSALRELVDTHKVEQWRSQIATWADQGLKRREMVAQMGMRHATAYAIIEQVMGPADEEVERKGTVVGSHVS